MNKYTFATLIALIVLFPLILFFIMTSNSKTNDIQPTQSPAAEVSFEATNNAVIETTLGSMTVELYGDATPETVTNFVTLAQEGKYNGVPFHRVIEDFMIQTGDFENQNGTGGYSYQGPGTLIPDEFVDGLTHKKGTLAMANRGPNTGASQFYIVHAEATPWLDGGHTVFGQLTEGFEVLDAIATAETDAQDQPLEPISIVSITID
jgi:peptidyl-prolyl cis-trans isomerase B (cyclophilin B)